MLFRFGGRLGRSALAARARAAVPVVAATGIAATGIASLSTLASESKAAPPPADNPLLSPAALFPKYADIRAKHVEPALKARLAEAESKLASLEADIESKLAKGVTPSYTELNDRAEQIAELVFSPWGAVNHLKSVKDTDELRKAVQATQPDVVKFSNRMSQSAALYRGWVALRADKHAWAGLSSTQRRVAEMACSRCFCQSATNGQITILEVKYY